MYISKREKKKQLMLIKTKTLTQLTLMIRNTTVRTIVGIIACVEKLKITNAQLYRRSTSINKIFTGKKKE